MTLLPGGGAFDECDSLVEHGSEGFEGSTVAALPLSLQAALEQESEREGVSLDQQVVRTLASHLSELATTRNSAAGPIIRAFLEVRDGYSADRVVADPVLNEKFLDCVRRLGVTGTDFQLNWTLFNARKNGLLSVPTRTRRYTVAGKDEFEFATEMAICHIQRRLERETGHSMSLDRIICDPELAKQFDATAALLAPGYSPIEYRWVVLGLRKARRFSKKVADVECPQFQRLGRAIDIRASSIAAKQGLYTIRTDDLTLYVGETDNLRHRIEHHFDSSHGGALIPNWLYDVQRNDIQLGILPLDQSALHQSRKVLELGCIGKYRPPLNYVCGQSK